MNLDFETFSECDLKKFGAARYSRDQSTDVLCLAYSDGEKVRSWFPSRKEPTKLLYHVEGGGIIRAWNAYFEYCIWNHVCVPKYGWPPLAVEQLRCTATDAMILGLYRGLENTADMVMADHLKSKEGRKLLLLFSKPQRVTRNQPHRIVGREERPEEFKRLVWYCKQDVRAERAVHRTLPKATTKMHLKMYHLTVEINERGLPIDNQLVRHAILALNNYDLLKREEFKKLVKGFSITKTTKSGKEKTTELKSTTQAAATLEFLRTKGILMSNMQKATVDTALEEVKKRLKKTKKKSDRRRLKEGLKVLKIRQSQGGSSVKKFMWMRAGVCDDGTVKGGLVPFGAHTGRYAGQGLQVQNLPRASFDNPAPYIRRLKRPPYPTKKVLEVCQKLVRPAICAPKGYHFVVSDFKSIEGVITLWYGGEKRLLKQFAAGADFYIMTAAGVFNKAYKDVTKGERQFGKVVDLACGFGGGENSLIATAKANFNLKLVSKEARRAVKSFRAARPGCRQFMFDLSHAAIECVGKKGKVEFGKLVLEYVKGYDFRHPFNENRVSDNSGYLSIRLPSGRKIWYPDAQVRKVKTPWGEYVLAVRYLSTHPQTKKPYYAHTTPGKITENVVQATAYDLLSLAMLRTERHGFDNVFCVHDETVTLQKKNSTRNLKRLNNIMEMRPNWCRDLPIIAEGWEGKRYKKD